MGRQQRRGEESWSLHFFQESRENRIPSVKVDLKRYITCNNMAEKRHSPSEASSICITWELISQASSQASPQPNWINNGGSEAQLSVVNKPFQEIPMIKLKHEAHWAVGKDSNKAVFQSWLCRLTAMWVEEVNLSDFMEIKWDNIFGSQIYQGLKALRHIESTQ